MSNLVRTSIAEDAAGSVATVTISRPGKLNSLNSELLTLLASTIRSLSTKHGNLICIVLTGDGNKAFAAGADLVEMSTLTEPAQARAFISRIHDVCTAIRECPAVVIARINGIVLGGGLEIAAACDLRFATSNAIFGMPEVRMGLPSVIEAALLPSLIGWGRCREFLLLGDTISAEEALRWGLITRVADGLPALDTVIRAAVESLGSCGRKAIKSQKALMTKWEGLPVDAAIDAGIECFGQAFELEKDSPAGHVYQRVSEPRRMIAEFLNQKAKSAKL